MATSSRFEVEHLHRLMMQASVDAAQHDRRLQDEQKQDGLSTLLRHWHEAAGTLHVAVQRVRTDLQKDGTPREQLERITERLVELQRRAKSFDLEKDLEDCVGHWKSLSLELGQLSGPHRDTLVKALGSRQPRIDEATTGLSAARRTSGMAPDNYRRVRDLQAQREASRQKYERLREKYLDAEREHHKEHGKAAVAAAHGTPGHAAHKLAVGPLAGRHGPIVVKLPDAKGHGASHAALPGRPAPGARVPHIGMPPAQHARPAHAKAHHAPAHHAPKPPAHHGPAQPHAPAHHGPAQPHAPAHHGPAQPHAPAHHGPAQPHAPRATSLRSAQRPASLDASTGARRAQGPLRISLEKIERPIGFPTGMDGIGRGSQTAHIYFRAENFDGALSISGTTAIQLGAACRLDVAPSLQLFSAAPGAPVRGRLSLGLVSSGGRLGTVSPRNALDGARGAARGAASRVADKIGPIGQQLQGAIADVLGEAADKIFARAQPNAIPHRLPQRQPGQPRPGPHHRPSLPVEHHVARFDHALGGILHEARSVKGAGQHRHSLHRVLDREHAHRDGVATRLEQTLGHLATAAHRTLTDTHAGELRNNLARMDSILARLRGKRGDELLQGAHEIGQILSQMGSIASSKGGSPHIGNFRKLIDERRSQLAAVAGEARKGQSAHPVPHRGPLPHMPSAQVLGERALERLRKQHPGLDKLLRNASSTQLAHELSKVEKGALHALQGRGGHARHAPQPHHRLGGTDLLGRGGAMGGAHLGGLGGGHRGGALGQSHGQGGLGQLDGHHAHILHKEAQRQGASHRHHAVAKALGELKKSPAGSPLHQLAVKTEQRRAELATKNAGHQNAVPPSVLTAAAFQDVFKSHGKGQSFAGHFAQGGALHSLVESAQRGHGLPISHMASHYLASRGHSHLWNAVQTFHGLVKGGHKPRFGFWSHLKDSVKGAVHQATSSVSRTVSSAVHAVQAVAAPVAAGMSSFANRAFAAGANAMHGARAAVGNVVSRGVGAARRAGNFLHNTAGRAANFVHRSVANASQSAFHSLGRGLSAGANALSHVTQGARDWAGHQLGNASSWVKQHGKALAGQIRTGGAQLWSGMQHGAHWLGDKSAALGQAAWQGAKNVGGMYLHGLQAGMHAAGGALSWAQKKVGGAAQFISDKAGAAAHWASGKLHQGLEWVKKTGVVGAVGGALRKGVSTLGSGINAAWKASPLGMAVSKGWGLAKNPLAKIWGQTKSLAGKAWSGIQSGYKATAGFLQSPAGQFLVTGLSLAATFIPGGLVVKTLIGAGIGAISAISEGKDWKGVLAGAAGGAISGALPFLKIGPLAKIGVGALQGAVGAVASGGGWKDALKGAAGGALDSVDPGAFKALSKLKGISAAEKLLKGKDLGKLEKLAVSGKLGGPLRLLEKTMANPRARGAIQSLEKFGGKAVKGGIWVAGKAGKAEELLNKTLDMGDKVHGALQQISEKAPGVAGFFGDNAVGHFISKAGDYAGMADGKLGPALEWGHGAADKVGSYNGYLKQGLQMAGVKNPDKAYARMQARSAARGGHGGALAQQKLQDHREKHPELHLARATGKRTRQQQPHSNGVSVVIAVPVGPRGRGRAVTPGGGSHGFPDPHHGIPTLPGHGGTGPGTGPGDIHKVVPVDPRHGSGGRHRPSAPPHGGGTPGKTMPVGGHSVVSPHGHQAPPAHHRRDSRPQSALEKAIARGQNLKKQGLQVAAGVHKDLGHIHGLVSKGLAQADKVQHGLEQATNLARQGAGILGEDSELGRYLLHVADRADQAHEYISQGIGFAHEFNSKLGTVNHAIGSIPGVHEAGHDKRKRGGPQHKPGHPLHDATLLDGRHPHGPKHPSQPSHPGHPVQGKPAHPGHPQPDVKKPTHESDAQHAARLKQAWEQIGNVSRQVQAFESKYAKRAAKVQELLHKGLAQAASLELQGLGGDCEEIQKYISRAKTLAHGHAAYEKEIKFYEEWHAKARAKVHGTIADTKGLGGQTAVSGFGIDEKRHPEIFQNTRDIYGIQAKVNAFGAALGDHEARAHVEKVLAEAKAARAHLQSLKGRYKHDKAALDFLTGHGVQDKLIDESIARLEKALHGAGPAHAHHGTGVKRPADHKKPDQHAPHFDVRQGAEHGLQAIEKYKKQALKTGRKVDHGLTKIEHALRTGLHVGRKVDHGLQKVSGIAGQVSKLFGEDSAIGHFASQVHGAADAGHEKLHGALKMAHTGGKQLHKGHAIFHDLMEKAAGHHEQKHAHEKQPRHAVHHGPHGPMHHVVHHGPHGPEHHVVHHGPHGPEHHVVHHGPHGPVHQVVHGPNPHHPAHRPHGPAHHGPHAPAHHGPHGPAHHGPHGPAHHGPHGPAHHGPHHPHGPHHGKGFQLPHGLKLPKVLQDVVDKAKGLKDLPGWLMQHLGLGGGGQHGPHKHHHHHHHGPGPQPSPNDGPHPGGEATSQEEAAGLVHQAGAAVEGFGKSVTEAIAAIQVLMHEGRTKDAGQRVQAVHGRSEHTRAACTHAVAATAKHPALHKQAQALSKHYLEIRSHFFKFVSTLHGLAGTGEGGLDAKKYPDVAALSGEVGSLEIKVNALGDVKSADSAMQASLAPLRKEAAALQQRIAKLQAKYQKDAPAEEALGQLASKVGRLQRVLSGHGDKDNVKKGDHDLGVEPAPHPSPQPGPHPGPPSKRDPVDQMLDGILNEDGRLFIDRGPNRGDVEQHDGQEVDPSAQDTWLGSGRGVEMFSQVFGSFLPAHGARTHVHHHAHGGGGGHGGGERPHEGPAHHGRGEIPDHHEPHHGRGEIPDHHEPHHGPGGIPGHHGPVGPHGRRRKGRGGILGRLGKLIPGKVKGFFSGLFDHLHGFADKISGFAHKGAGLLGQGMHFAEMGMHGLKSIEGAAAKVQGFAGKAEGFLNKLHLGKAAGFAHKIGGAAGWVDKEAHMLHGGLKTADKWMGAAKKDLGAVEKFSNKAGRAFGNAEQGHFGGLLNLFKSSRAGDGIDGKLSPDKVRLGSQFDEPRRLDGATMGRMEGFLGGSFGGVRVHTGPGAAEITGRFNAEAVTVKDHIFFAPGRFNPQTTEGQKLLAHELTHVMQRGRKNLDVRTAESEALHSERSYGSPDMETLNLGKPSADFKLADGEGLGASTGIHTAKRNRSRGHETGGKDQQPDGEQFLELVSGRVYELLMEELESSFESR